MGLVLELQHDHAQVDLPRVADGLPERVEVHLRVEVLEETVLYELSLLRTEDVFDSIPPAIVLLDSMEILNKEADVLRVFFFGVLLGGLEGSNIPKYQKLYLYG